MELQEDTALQVSGCSECMAPITRACGLLACRKRAVVQKLFYKVKMLQEEVNLHSIKEDKRDQLSLF